MDSIWVNVDGEIVENNSAIFGIDNRAFKYGDGLFETFRVINGKPLFVEQHLFRLKQGMKALRMDIPGYFEALWLNDQINALLMRAGISKGGRVRLSVFRKSGGCYVPKTNEISFVIEADGMDVNQFVLNEKGLIIDIFEGQKRTINEFSTIKSVNCLPFVLAGIHQKEKELGDCILLNELGNISEAVSSNIFIVYNGVFYTPSLNQGCIDGIMRKNVIALLNHNGYEVQECPLGPNALLRADEVFLTNSVKGIQWVSAYKMKRYFNKFSRQLTENLNEMVINPAAV